MLLEKSENLLQLFVKKLLIQSSLANVINVACSKVVSIFCIQQDLSKYKSDLKGNNKLKSLSKVFVQVVFCQLFQEICIKK